MNRLILLVGIPGSGKTTLSKRLVDRGCERLCADDIRLELYGDEADQGNPKDVFAKFFARLEALLQAKKDIVIDNTNVKFDHRRQIIERAHKANCKDIQLWVLDVPLALCLQRNKERTRQVPEKVLERLFHELNGTNKPNPSEGRIVVVTPGKDGNWNFEFSAPPQL